METQFENIIAPASIFYQERYHKFFIQVATYVRKHGGTLAHAEDLYHDALTEYYVRHSQPGFVIKTSEESYVMGIVKNMWSRKIKAELETEDLPESTAQEDPAELIVNYTRLHRIILSAGKKCLDMLTMFYHHQSSVRGIADTFGFTSEHSASVQKYKCIEKIRETIRQNSLCHEDFFE